MLHMINRYSHGYTFIPVVGVLKKHSFFSLLETSAPKSGFELGGTLNANQGHLQTALIMLESIGWLEKDELGYYSLLPEAENHRFIEDDMITLYEEHGNDWSGYEKWTGLSLSGWNTENRIFADMLDGPLVLPVLYKLAGVKIQDGNNLAAKIPAPFIPLFRKKGWIDTPGAVTPEGRSMITNAANTGVTLSYCPMLRGMEELLFGDCEKVFHRDEHGYERHIDRRLNITGSGNQHQKFFAALDEGITTIFNAPQDEQPDYVADTGCGDGSLLQRVYGVIKNKTSRGKILETHPVTMIGIDYNRASVEKTQYNLAQNTIPARVMQGDILKPAEVMAKLEEMNSGNKGNILHIRSFLDHNRPYQTPKRRDEAQNRLAFETGNGFTGTDGRAIPPNVISQNLVEHMEHWGDILKNHPLILLEVHSLDPFWIRRFFDQSESFHFDACHRFSNQYLVDIHTHFLAAAEAGLFADFSTVKTYPATLSYSRISLASFTKKEYSIRNPRRGDRERLFELENLCWEKEIRTPRQVLKQRIETYPAGQYIIEYGDETVGVMYTQRIDNAEDLKGHTVRTVDLLHNPSGPVVQLLGISIHPDYTSKGLGRILRDFVVGISRISNGVEKIVGVTRCRDFNGRPPEDMLEYINTRNDRGFPLDPIIAFHLKGGARIVRQIPGFRPNDWRNQGIGVLIEYSAGPGGDSKIVESKADNPSPATDTEEGVEDYILKLVKMIKQDLPDSFKPNTPLEELGFDSMDTMELISLLEKHFGFTLEPGFLLKYNSTEKIIGYGRLKQQSSPKKGQGLPKLGVPDLSDTCDRLVSTLAPLLSGEKQQSFKKLVDNFKKNEGPVLHQKLVEYNSFLETNYVFELRRDFFLSTRSPLPVFSNPGLSLSLPENIRSLPLHRQAAAVCRAALTFHLQIKEGTLPPDMEGDKPLCMGQYGDLFGTARIPGKGCDTTIKTEKPARIIVMRRNHFYILEAVSGEEIVPLHILEAQIKAILESGESPGPALGGLTALPRDEWAQIYDYIIEEKHGFSSNSASILSIYSALFVLCLDETDPKSAEDRAVNTLGAVSNWGNRWFDAGLQLILTPGVLGVNFEHSLIDGTPVIRFLRDIRRELETPSPRPPAPEKHPLKVPEPQKLEFQFTPAVLEKITRVEDETRTSYRDLSISILKITAFGAGALKKKGLIPDGILQYLFQKVYFRLNGTYALAYEPVHTRRFAWGRTEALYPLTDETVRTIETFKGGRENLESLTLVSRAHQKLLYASMEGRGIHRHLFGMRYHAKQAGMEVPLFSSPEFALLSSNVLSTSCLDGKDIDFFVFGPEEKNGYGIAYSIRENGFTFTISAWKPQKAGEFTRILKEELEALKLLLMD